MSQVNVNAGGTATSSPGPLSYARRVVALLFGILIVLIALRFLLLALGANTGNALVDFIYNVSEPFVAVFRGVFSFDRISPVGRSVIDVAALVAIVGYALLAIVMIAILRLGDRDRRGV
ncbi:MAG: YggT family protein [Actinomycetota bacterium]|nr:YggT family protein [Actinomycetota bacterium]